MKAPNTSEKFASYTRDSYTGLDYADQRFYASSYGRFNTSDPARNSEVVEAFVSWNRYAYVYGDPINRMDPSGLTSCDANGDNCYDSITVSATDPSEVTYGYAITSLSGVGIMRPPLSRYSVFALYGLGLDLAQAVNGTTYTSCQAVGDYANAAACGNGSTAQFVNDFRNLNPDAVNNSVQLYASGDNGFQAQYQNTENDLGTLGNGDQVHHLAFFLQLGYQLGSSGAATLGAIVLEQYEALTNSTVVNAGDVALGIAAAQIGAGLRTGTESILTAVNDIKGLCK